VQPAAGRGGHAEEHADPGGHGRRSQQVAAGHPPRPSDGQVAEHEQQLGRQDGLDLGQVAKRSTVTWKANLPIMAAMPPSQAGRRASRTRSRTSKPAAWSSLAPLRWHSEAVAVHTLAATASRIGLIHQLAPSPGLSSPGHGCYSCSIARPDCIGRVLLVTVPGPRRHRPDGVSLPGHAQGSRARHAAGDRLAPGSVLFLAPVAATATGTAGTRGASRRWSGRCLPPGA
jgi:hypothetical protein